MWQVCSLLCPFCSWVVILSSTKCRGNVQRGRPVLAAKKPLKRSVLHGFIWFSLNNSMKTRHDHAPISDAWLRENGIVPSTLLTQPLYVLRAQRIAHHLLKHHVGWLNPAQQQGLRAFCAYAAKAKGKKKAQSRVSKSACIQVMNLGSALNRRLFKEQRQRYMQMKKRTTKPTSQSVMQSTTLAT